MVYDRTRAAGRSPGSRHRLRRAAVFAATTGLLALAAGCGSPAPRSAASGPRSLAAAVGTRELSSGQGSVSPSQGLVSPPTAPRGRSGLQTRPARPGGASATADGRSGVTGGALFGGTASLTRQEGRLGRRLAIVRVYYHIGERFPTAGDRKLMAAGRSVLVSLDTYPGHGPDYAAIAAGRQDAAISTFLREVNQAAVSYRLGAIYICFEHEADVPAQHAGLGSPSEFVAAWDHIHALAESARLDWNQGGRLHWTLILSHTAYVPMAGRQSGQYWAGAATAFWPGSAEVDIVAADGYNSGTCRLATPHDPGPKQTQAVSPAVLFGPLLAFALAHGGLPVFIAEWASASYASPGIQPGFIHQMQAYVTANPQIAAAMYWDLNQGGICGYVIDGHPASMTAMTAMGHSAALQGRIAPVG